MFKVLLLALGCALAHAHELSGDWHTMAIAANNRNKISEEGPLRLYLRHLECRHGCEELAVTFYVHVNGDCQKVTTVAKHTGDGFYEVEYEGQNRFEVVKHTGDFIAFSSKNVDDSGKVTKLIFLVGTSDGLDEEQKAKLEQCVEEKGISKDNIEYVLDTDVCPK